MSSFTARVYVGPKPTVRDPEGSTILDGLHQLGFRFVEIVRSGRYFEVVLEAPNDTEAASEVDRMCRTLLANPVIEHYRYDLHETPATA